LADEMPFRASVYEHLLAFDVAVPVFRLARFTLAAVSHRGEEEKPSGKLSHAPCVKPVVAPTGKRGG